MSPLCRVTNSDAYLHRVIHSHPAKARRLSTCWTTLDFIYSRCLDNRFSQSSKKCNYRSDLTKREFARKIQASKRKFSLV